MNNFTLSMGNAIGWRTQDGFHATASDGFGWDRQRDRARFTHTFLLTFRCVLRTIASTRYSMQFAYIFLLFSVAPD